MINSEDLIGKNIDQFRLDEFLGQGAMGIVFKALDNTLQRTVALKLIPKGGGVNTLSMVEARKRLIQEAQAAGRLVHPNIVTIHSYGETDEFQYICMEYIVGQTLGEVLTERKFLPVEESMAIIEQVLLALDVAHKEGIVHRDIKPANIMILPDKRVKVMDFGIAKLPSLSTTTTGTVLGTPYYMSPEQISGQKVDIISDIFSVGAVFYQILTGTKPFEGETTVTLAYKIVQVDPLPLKILNVRIPLVVENICKKALTKDTTSRYQTPMEMLEDIRAFLSRGRGKEFSSDATIRTKVSIPVTKPQETKKESETVFSPEKVTVKPAEAEVKPVEVEITKPEPLPSTTPPKKESPPPVKPSAPKTSSVPDKSGESPKKTIPITVGLLMILVVGIFLGVRYLKRGAQYSGAPPAAVQTVNKEVSKTNPPQQKSISQSDNLILQAKEQLKSNPANARKLLDQALSLDPNSFEANFHLARLLTFQQDFQNAIPVYQKAQKLNNRVPEISFNLGYIYMNQGQFDQAIKFYEVCLALSPPFQDEVLTNLGYCYLQKNNSNQARILFKKALELNPQNNIAQKYLKSIGG